MSTRALYKFVDPEDGNAFYVYKHSDGYPTGGLEAISGGFLFDEYSCKDRSQGANLQKSVAEYDPYNRDEPKKHESRQPENNVRARWKVAVFY